jgi:hypothetical protein
MEDEYSVLVFGKKDCDKCKVLNKRLDTVLKDAEYGNFTKQYYDVTQIDGLVQFSRSEVLNPQRIPAFLVLRKNEEGEFERIPQTFEEGFGEDGKFRFPTFVGLQTDYSDGGLIRPDDIREVLQEAISS